MISHTVTNIENKRVKEILNHCKIFYIFIVTIIMNSSANVDINLKLPWPPYRKYFDCLKYNENLEDSKKSTYTVRCNQCKVNSTLSTSASSSFNLKRHIKTKHLYLLKNLERELINKGIKRGAEELVGSEPPEKNLKQSTLLDIGKSNSTSQDELNAMIADAFVDGNISFKTVERRTFIKLIKRGFPKLRVIGRKQLSNKITKKAKIAKENKISKLKGVEKVALTLDLWTVHGRSYMGVTCHWLENDLARNNTAISLKRVRGRHTYDVIARVIQDVCEDYEIQDKVVRITTDSAKNFVKAFKSFGNYDENAYAENDAEQEEEVEETELVFDEEGNEDSSTEVVEIDEIDNSDNENDAVPQLLDNILNDEDAQVKAAEQEIFLPPHHRCASHKFNLVATSDANKAEYKVEFVRGADGKNKKTKSISLYGKKKKDTVSRCKELWNIQGRSSYARELIEEEFGRLFPTPGVTRWNSEKDALEYLNSILTSQEKKKKLNDKICAPLKISIFRQTDVEFIGEYLQVMTPVAVALDNLQGDINMYMGSLLPNVLMVLRELQNLKNTSKFKYCQDLITACINGVNSRFNDEINDKALIIAAACHPEYKLKWAAKESGPIKRNEVEQALKEEFRKMAPTFPAPAGVERHQEKKKSSLLVEDSDSDSDMCIDKESELTEYLSRDCDSVKYLNRFSVMKAMFCKFNTPLPASGSVERMFSIAGDICTRKRGKMSDVTFENSLLYKYSLHDNF